MGEKLPTGVRARGEKFEYRVQYRDESGRLFKHSESGFDTPYEAACARDKWLEAVMVKDIKTKTRDWTFVEVWEEKTHSGVYKEASIRKRDSLLKNHIVPYWGTVKIAKITPGDIKAFLTKKGERTEDCNYHKDIVYSQEYIFGIYKAMKVTFDYALENDMIDKNPMLKVKATEQADWCKKGIPKEEGRYLYAKELSVIDSGLKTSNTYASFVIAINTGARISEIFGLTWDDIDFDSNEVYINKQLLYSSEKGLWWLSSLKRTASDRKVPMSQPLREFLLELKDKQEKNKERYGSAYENGLRSVGIETEDGEFFQAYVHNFVNVKPKGEFLTSDSTKYATRRVEKTTGKHRFLIENDKGEMVDLDFSYHDFRHTFLTELALEGNIPLDDLQKLAGHSKPETTKKYYIHDRDGRMRVDPQRDIKVNNTLTALSAAIKAVKPSENDAIVCNDSADGKKKKEQIIDLPSGHFKNGIFYRD